MCERVHVRYAAQVGRAGRQAGRIKMGESYDDVVCMYKLQRLCGFIEIELALWTDGAATRGHDDCAAAAEARTIRTRRAEMAAAVAVAADVAS